MATITFRVHYQTRWGEDLLLERVAGARDQRPSSREWLPMTYEPGGFWVLKLEGLAPESAFDYRYECRSREGETRREPEFRQAIVGPHRQAIRDFWLAPELPDAAFLRQAFAGVIFNPPKDPVPPVCPEQPRRLRLTLRAARVPAGHRICVCGAHELLGNWDMSRAAVMSGENYPLWQIDLPAAGFTRPLEFKFGIWSDQLRRAVELEHGDSRWLEPIPADAERTIWNCEHYQHQRSWRGAGVAIPVFSLRTQRGYGIGEFADLAEFARWAAGCHLHLVQILPINDTSSDFTWQDSYPYKAISTAALHPIYLNLDQLFADCGKPLPPGYDREREVLNCLPQLDYEAVLKHKLRYLRELFSSLRPGLASDGELTRYIEHQAAWLHPYAAFCRLRDLHRTADFTRWGRFATYSPDLPRAWFDPQAPEFPEVLFHCWLQFHLDRQLQRALAFGHACGVAFKGDLPIGIDRASVEAWTQPDLFRMDRQTGAPPDAFAVLGQNWGFPTYNWQRMEADGYHWWQRRFHRMAEAFDALRIDHILGFFRIWEIPRQYSDGIFGHYHPALPLDPAEIRSAGFNRDPRLFSSGALPQNELSTLFGPNLPLVGPLLAPHDDGFFRLRPEYAFEPALNLWLSKLPDPAIARKLQEQLKVFSREILFLEDPDQPGRFHPRINLSDTLVFKTLPERDRHALRELHDDFFHRRHTAFWAHEALKKLPVLMDASPMLICGEDLGMVPQSVPLVLQKLGLLSLEVQRWPKDMGKLFGDPLEYPYLSVCTTSTHDMSTIRGWWEEEPQLRQRFHQDVMNRTGQAPEQCSVEICRFIVAQNLAGNSMWCILPLQDWLSLDSKLRHPLAAAERINVPAIPRHYWRYRMHLTIEDLAQAEGFQQALRDLVADSRRAQNP